MQLGNTYRIVWHYRATDERRTTTISYRVIGAVIAYDDVLDIGWTVWGADWDFDLDRLTASFTNPALDPGDPLYRVWGHPRDVEGETVRGEGAATLEADQVDSGTAVELRVTMPRDPARSYPSAREGAGEWMPGILAEEQALDEDFDSPWNRFKRFVFDYPPVFALGLAAISWLIVVLLLRLTRERDTGVPEYLTEPPDDAGPAVAYALATEGADSVDTVLATLLDLVDRGYYATTQVTIGHKRLDLALELVSNRPKGELAPHERSVLDFFDRLLDGKRVAMSELKDEVPQHSSAWRERWERMTEKLDAVDEVEVVWDRDLNWARWLTAVGSTLAFAFMLLLWLAEKDGWRPDADSELEFAFVLLLALAKPDSWVPATVITLFSVIRILALPAVRFKRLDADHVARTARWQAFARWTRDFPGLADDPPATLDVWKRILIYGVAFGTAERMIASSRIPAPVAADASAGGHWSSYAFVGGFNRTTFDGSTFSSGFSSQVAPESSSTGGGGGFSGGGGGGFSGGGGGGSW